MRPENRKEITVVIEASATGFGVYSHDLPGITGYGKTVAEAKEDFEDAISGLLESESPDPALNGGHLDYTCQYDLPGVFQHFGMLNLTSLSKKIGINDSLLRQYKNGIVPASEKQRQRIEKGLHDLGNELLRVRL
jgi:predicted RNase H-like HicB family nuclease